jgi:hypothetical protein
MQIIDFARVVRRAGRDWQSKKRGRDKASRRRILVEFDPLNFLQEAN